MVAVLKENFLWFLLLPLTDSQVWRSQNYCSDSFAGISGSNNQHNYYTDICYSIVHAYHLDSNLLFSTILIGDETNFFTILSVYACVISIFLPPPVQSMVFITILLFTVTYIFAIAGVIFFESYTRSNRQDLVFHQSFRLIASRMKLSPCHPVTLWFCCIPYFVVALSSVY